MVDSKLFNPNMSKEGVSQPRLPPYSDHYKLSALNLMRKFDEDNGSLVSRKKSQLSILSKQEFDALPSKGQPKGTKYARNSVSGLSQTTALRTNASTLNKDKESALYSKG